MAKYTREPINGFTHLFGAILSFAGLLILVIKTTLENPSPVALTAVIIFINHRPVRIYRQTEAHFV